jgi:hypothetical protein
MTLQQIFDKSAVHLLTQNKKAKSHGSCQYRGDGGTMCAVGCLIPDEHYSKDIEGCGVSGAWHARSADPYARKLREALMASGIDIDDAKTMRMLDELQTIHDNHPVELWLGDLRDLAENFSLNAEALVAFQA